MSKRIKHYLRTIPVVWLCILSLVLTTFAAENLTGSGTILDGTLSHSWTGVLTKQGSGEQADGSQALAEVSEEKSSEKGGSFVYTITATTAKYSSSSSCGTTTHYRPSDIAVTAEIMNTSGSPVRLTKIEVQTDTGTGSSYSKEIGTTLGVNEKLTLKTTADTSEDKKESVSVTYKVKIEFEYVANLNLKADPSEYVDYSFSASGTEYNVADSTVTQEFAAGTQVTPTITVPDGYTFHGWRLSTGELLAEGASFALNTDTTIYPVLVSPDQQKVFQVGSTASADKQFWFWEDAVAAAKVSSETILLLTDHTLPNTMADAGVTSTGGAYVTGSDNNVTYVIPSGVNLLIPYGANDSGSFGAEPKNYITFSEGLALFDKNKLITERNFAYCTLTVPSGAKIDCYGALNPNGQRQPDSQPYSGATLGGYGKIKLNGSGTQLTVHNGGALYCYGYITGSGMVEILNGGKIHEFLQLCDWTGGSHASNWKSASEENQSLFLLSQYYVQSVEAPVTIRYGARAYCEAVLTGSGLTGTVTKPVSVPYITENKGLFILQDSNSYIVRQYNAEQDRMTYNLYGNIKVGSISVTVTHGISITLSSEEYVLPLPSNMTFIVQSGTTTMDKNVAILPGAKGIVSQGAAMNLSGKLYVVDVNDWTNNYFFNRAYFTPNTGFSMVNKTPNMAPLPYVATLNTISPRARAYVRGKDGSTQHYYMDAINATESGKLEVNGTLNITGSGSICTTKQTESIETDTLTSEDVNKVVTGNGFINYESTPAAGTLSAGFNGTITTITTANGYGNLAGVGTLQPFATGDYYGTGDYWYQHIINTEGGSVTVTSTNGAAGSNLSPLDGRKTQNIVARVANGGSITYTIPAGYGVSINDTLQTPDDKGVYTLSSITTDTTLVLHEHSYSYGSVEDYSATGTCSVCGSTTTVSVPVSFEAIQLSVEAEVMLRLKITVADDFNGTIVLTETENERAGGPQVTVYTMDELATVEIDDNGRYVLDQGIAAGEMTGIVSIEAYDADANKYYISDYKGGITTKLTRTVLQYVELAMNSTASSDDLKALMKNMVTFGGYAQEYFGVDVENPAYDILPKYEIEIPDVTGLKSTDIGVSDRTWAPVGAAAASDLLLEEETEAATEPTEAEPEVTETTAPTEPEITEPETTEATEPEGTETTEGTESTEMTETTVSAEPTESVSTDPTEAESTEPAATESVITEVTERTPNVANSGASVETKSTPPALNFMMELTAIQAEAISETVPTETIPAETIAEALTGTEAQSEEFLPMEIIVSQSSATPATPMAADAVTGSSTFGLQYDGQSVVLDSRVELKTYFTLENADISDYTFVLTYTEGKQTKTRTVTTEPEEKEGSLTGRHYVKFEVPVAYWDYEYILTAYKGDPTSATEAYALKSSVLVWSKNCIADYEDRVASSRWPADGTEAENAKAKAKLTAQYHMAQAMYYYNQAANIYFDR